MEAARLREQDCESALARFQTRHGTPSIDRDVVLVAPDPDSAGTGSILTMLTGPRRGNPWSAQPRRSFQPRKAENPQLDQPLQETELPGLVEQLQSTDESLLAMQPSCMEQGRLDSLFEKSKDATISAGFDVSMNYLYETVMKSSATAGVGALLFQTMSNDVITALFLDHLLHRKKGNDDFSTYVGRSRASRLLKEIEKIQKELPEDCSEITRQYMQGVHDAYKEVLDDATSKVHRTLNKVGATVGDVIKKGAIGLTTNALGILLGIGPIAQVGLAKLIDWFLGQFGEEGYWRGTSLQDVPEELRLGAAYQRGRAHGKAACCHELLRLRNELWQEASLSTLAS